MSHDIGTNVSRETFVLDLSLFVASAERARAGREGYPAEYRTCARGRDGKARGRSKEAGARTGPASWFHPHPARGAAEGRNADGRPFRSHVRTRFGKGGSFVAGRRGHRGCRKRRERQGRRALLRFAGVFADPVREGRLRRGPCEADPSHAGRGSGTREKGGSPKTLRRLGAFCVHPKAHI